MLQGGSEDGFAKLAQDHPWLPTTSLVAKPDQLIKRRGKAGLLAVNKSWAEVQTWIAERMGKSQQVRALGLLCPQSSNLCCLCLPATDVPRPASDFLQTAASHL